MKVIVLLAIVIFYSSILVFGSKPCPTVILKNGSVKYRSKGRIAKFRCNRGFVLNGDNIGACIGGQWDVDIPVCVFRSRCSAITEIRNGHVLSNKQWTSLRFICNNGYHLVGRSQLQCKNSKWDGEPPQCLTSVQLTCDFEKRGICGWDNSTKNGYFWLKRQYATPSHYLDTGPGHDHTLQPKNNGHYLYIETSGLNGRDLRSTIARLHSPLFPPVENNGTCFTFWYHMYGSTIGELIVYVDGHKVFHKSGNHGNRWIKGIVKNLPTDTFFQISIEGLPGSGWTGDIAIDDLNITTSAECTGPDIEDTTCDGRCYEEDVYNSTLCQCNQNCISKATCCSDYFNVCDADLTSTIGLRFSSLVSEDETTFIASEDLFQSSTISEFNSGTDFTNINTNTNEFAEQSITDTTTTADELSFSTIYNTNYTNYDTSTDLEDIIALTESPYTTSAVKELDTEQSIDYNKLITQNPSSSYISTHIYTSDLALDYSDTDYDIKKKNNSEVILEEKKYSDSNFGKYKYSVSTIYLDSSSTSTESVSSNSSLKNSNLTIGPEEKILLTNVTTKTLVIHTHLQKNESSVEREINLVNETLLSNSYPVISSNLSETGTSQTVVNQPLFSYQHITEPSYLASDTANSPRNKETSQPSNISPTIRYNFSNTSLPIVTMNTTKKESSSDITPLTLFNNSPTSTYLPNITTELPKSTSHLSVVNDSFVSSYSPVVITTSSDNKQNYKNTTRLSLLNDSFVTTYLPIVTFNLTNSVTTSLPFFNVRSVSSHLTKLTSSLPEIKTAFLTTTESPSVNVNYRTTYSPLWTTASTLTEDESQKTIRRTSLSKDRSTSIKLPTTTTKFTNKYMTQPVAMGTTIRPTQKYTTQHTKLTTETVPVSVQIVLARTERTKWKSVYQPKGYYTYSAMKLEKNNSNGLKSIGIIVTIAVIFIISAAIGIYVYRRRSFLNSHNNIEEADVLFVPTDEMLDFSIVRPPNRPHRKSEVNNI